MADALLKHAFVSAVAEGADATKVRTSNWNAPLLFSAGADGEVLTRSAASATGAAWTAASSGASLPTGVAVGSVLASNGVGVAPVWSTTPQVSGLSLVGGAVTRQRPNDNAPQILLTSTVPPEGRANEAPFLWWQAGATFSSEWDPVLYLGYNADQAIGTQPAARWVIEGNYNLGAGRRDVEMYWEYMDRANLAGATAWRPIFLTADKDSLGNKTVTLTCNQVQLDAYTVGPLTLKLRAYNANQPVNLVVGGGLGTSANTSNYLVISGGVDGASGASILAGGNTCTNVATDKGTLRLRGGVVAAPTAAQGFVGLYTGASTTERLRVQYDGNIAVAKVGVNATALVHLGPGIATAGFGPLKFTSGVNLTTAEAGAMEYDGTNLFFTRAGTVREGVLTQSAVTTEALTADRSVTVNIGGVTYKLLAKS